MMQKQFNLKIGATNLPFAIAFSRRRTMSIIVHPDKRVEVKAPILASMEQILGVIQKRTSWIEKQLQHFEEKPVKKIICTWESGESIYFLGKKLTLQIRVGKADVQVVEDDIIVFLPKNTAPSSVEKAIEKWYLAQAKLIFGARLRHFSYLPSLENATPIQTLRIKRLRRRWGSCSSSGNILLNTHLIKAPIACIDYVIIHELCHLKHMNHSKDYYATLVKYCPDWKQLKAMLEASER